jgi:O-glycosyl hydrolase
MECSKRMVIKQHHTRRTGGLFFTVVVAFLLMSAVSGRADYTATVNPGSVLVANFQGWGTSLCWWANVVGGWPNRTNFVDLAYNQLKLNIARYNIGGGENPTNNFLAYRAQMPGFEPTNGVWNWNADTNQRWVLQQALARGVNLVDAFANSPPWWMTVSRSVTGAVGATNNLLVSDETLFATYLANVVSNLTVLDGDHFNYVTPMNEPNGSKWSYGNSQEGCNISQAQQAPVINALRTALNTSLPAAGIDAAEDVDPYQSYSDLISYPSATINDLALCTTHTYSETGNSSLASEANSLGKSLWVAEYGDNDGTGLTMAQRIHDDITVMGARAWCYWQVIDNATGWGFLYNPLVAPTNASYTTNYTINEKFYAMGQFSEFVRPGNEIISVNDSSTLAAYNPTNSTLILVIVNTNTTSLNVTYNLTDFGSKPWQVIATQTSATESMAPLPIPIVTAEKFTSAIPAQSITTFTLTTNLFAPVITSQFPTPQTNGLPVFPGETLTLAVAVTGSVPLYYQWVSNGITVIGATNSSYTPPSTFTSNSVTLFNCLVSNIVGSATGAGWSVSAVPAPTAAYAQAVLALLPAGYWPMHEVEAVAPGDWETNYGTLGVLGTAYYPDWSVNSGAFLHQEPGALTSDTDAAVFFTGPAGGGTATNGLFVPHTSAQATLTPPFSAECWFMATNIGAAGGDILSQGDGTKTVGLRLYYQNSPSDPVNLLTYNGSAAGLMSYATASMASNQWHHLVLTCDAATNMSAWWDGTLVSGPTAFAGKYRPDNHVPFTVGTGLGNTRAFHGLIDEVAVYTNVLSDVNAHYTAGISGGPGAYFAAVTNDDPVIYLRMDSPAYSAPAVGSWPVLLNYGQTNGVVVNSGVYSPGTMPGVVNGPAYDGFPLALTGTNVAQLNGVSSFADAGNAPVFNPTGATPFSISAIFRGNPTDTNRVQSIVGHGTNSWELSMAVNGLVVFNSGTNSPAVVATGSGAGDLVSTGTNYDDGNWHQVVAVHNDTTNVLYLDGVANRTNVLAAANNTGNLRDVMIGADPSYTNNPSGLGRQFAGQVCEVAYFTNALTFAQVQTMYNAGVFFLPPAGLSITNLGGSQLQLDWNYGTLQSATNVAGPYSDMTNAVQPYTVPATNAQEFYRIREY